MTKKLLFTYIFVALLISCKKDTWQLERVEGSQISITDSIETKMEIDSFIQPFRNHVNKNLDSVISYAVDTYSKSDGELNTAIGNLFADVIYEQTNPVFKMRTGKNIDMVLVNHGGIRAIISKGNITTRTAYEIMPFENSIVVVALKGSSVNELISYLLKARRAHPISKLKILVDDNFNLINASINGEPIDLNKTYHVATNDYLYNGGDRMTFFQPNDSLYVMDYKVRNALLDYFLKTDTINPKMDDRFFMLKN